MVGRGWQWREAVRDAVVDHVSSLLCGADGTLDVQSKYTMAHDRA